MIMPPAGKSQTNLNPHAEEQPVRCALSGSPPSLAIFGSAPPAGGSKRREQTESVRPLYTRRYS
jgi:hypothetical protein